VTPGEKHEAITLGQDKQLPTECLPSAKETQKLPLATSIDGEHESGTEEKSDMEDDNQSYTGDDTMTKPYSARFSRSRPSRRRVLCDNVDLTQLQSFQ